jgi:soluble cytochrome b562
MQGKTWNPEVKHGDLTFNVRPLTYKETTDFFMTTFENQRLAQVMQDTKIDEVQKMKAFREGFKKLSQMTLDMICKHVTSIDTPEGSESETQAIKQFFENTDKATFTAIQNNLEKIKNHWATPTTKFKVPQDYVEKGADPEIDVPMVFDNASFFA